ncbi:vWA domain-containing protein [Kineosporia succinea]|uniref:Uncharacterized protein with von Willebrand factor type A (VWA) domain n=1 Tax=Kineosporia succinea TaxID=84632 RepID=A0ABT9NYQ8_9ACTN|nr:hypothetical protein [Kineosporia succinea]MDP9825574.1 uncharacterized protein with von Willebrand factor type A (vWA) domain [Kineosporia succinea]
MSPRRRDPRYRYGPWRGGPDPLAAPYDVRRALDALGDRVLSGENVREALRDLLRRGLPDENGRRTGLDELRARAERRRRETSRRGRLDGAVTRARAQLDQALAAEKEELALREGDDARFSEAQLDALPRSTAAAVQELSEYRWASKEAEQIYRQILDGLRTDVIDQQFNGMRNALQGLGPDADPQQRAAAMAAMNEMLDDLNGLLEKHARGEDTPEDFQRFMDRHGEMFPDDPQNVEELIDSLARQAAAAERLMNALSPQQREELQGLMQQALGNDGLQSKMGRLTDNLRALRPGEGWGEGRGEGRRMRGQGEMGYGEAAGALQELADLDDLIDQLSQSHPGATLDDVDVETVERSLGAGAAADVQALQELERELERQGWLTRADGALTLSPKALRRLGQTALRQVFAHLGSGRRGEHDIRDAGAAGEATGSSRKWEFGDEQPLDVVRSLRNAVHRSASQGAALTMAPEDFEVVETERRASAAVALCVDLSYSMISEGRWGPMKETALALAHLVATRFPQDALQIVGFGRYATKLTVEQLAGIEPDYVQGTNLQHALSIAGRHLRRHPDAEPVVLVVTDGEPTAHLEDGEAYFNWPPTPQTISLTVAEVDALTRYGAAINMFMLGENEGLRRFVDAIARRNGGRVFTPGLDSLGEYVVSDYLKARRGRR